MRRALSDTLDEQATRLEGSWTAAIAGDAEAMRRVRIATRRLREALRVVSRVDDRKRVDGLRRKLRATGQLFGPVRDLGVAADVLDALASGTPVGSELVEVADRRARDERKTLASLVRKTRRVDVDQLLAAARDLAKAIAARRDGPRWTQALVAAVAERTVEAAKAFDASGILYEVDRLHELRIAVKKLRYSLELAAAASLVSRAFANRLERHQKRLGAWHDRVALIGLIRAWQADGPSVSATSGGRLVDRLEHDARRWHGQVMRYRGSLARVLAEIRAKVAEIGVSGSRSPLRARLKGAGYIREGQAVATRGRGRI